MVANGTMGVPLRNLTSNQIVNYQEIVDKGIISSSTSAAFGALSFSINDLIQAASFAAIYDQYRISKVEIAFNPVCTQMISSAFTVTGGAANITVPYLYTAIDYDDANVPVSINNLTPYHSLLEVPATAACKRMFTPNWQTVVFTASTTALARGDPKTWLDLARLDIPHFGLKFALSADASDPGTARFQYRILVKYVVQFRQSRG